MISPSRPLSSMTTTTNRTITQRKYRENHPSDPVVPVIRTTYAPDLPLHHEIDEPVKSRKITFFGIPIPTPRKRSFSSRTRPNIPKQPPNHPQLRNLERVISAPSRAHDSPLPMSNSTNLGSTDDIPLPLQHSFDISEPDSGLGVETVNSSKPEIFAPQARPPHAFPSNNTQDFPDVPQRVSSSPPRLEKDSDAPTPKPRNPKRESSSGRSSPLVGLFKGKDRGTSNRVTSPTIVGLERRNSTKRDGSNTGRTITNITSPKIPKGRIKHGSFDFERPISSSVGSRGGFQSTPSSYTPSSSELGKGPYDGSWKGHSSTYVIQEEGPSLTREHSARSSSSRPTVETRIRFDEPPLPRSGQTSTNGSLHSQSQLPLPHVNQAKMLSAKTTLPPLPLRADSAATGQSSSWGRATGMRGAAGVTHGAHPAFSFEPSAAQKTDKFNLGRATGKGRSLDLGIDLNWAPTRVREEAVMKTRSRWREEAEMKESGRSQVAESFERVLGENGYAKFRECMTNSSFQCCCILGSSNVYRVVRCPSFRRKADASRWPFGVDL
jgi:hypothetical protein